MAFARPLGSHLSRTQHSITPSDGLLKDSEQPSSRSACPFNSPHFNIARDMARQRKLFGCWPSGERQNTCLVAGGHLCFYSTGQAFAFQISVAYSEIVRSLENLPELATLRIALRDQASGSAYRAPSRSWA